MNLFLIYLSICMSSSFFFFSTAADASTVTGQIWEKGRRIQLSGVQVYLLPQKLSATTDAQGRFEWKDVDLVGSPDTHLVINDSHYERYELSINEADLPLKIYLKKMRESEGLDFDVVDANLKRDQSKKSLSRKQILEMPGANGDPLKAVQNLPGINRTAGFSSQVVIQGSAPKDTDYDFEGHSIPLVFHFGGLSSVVMPEAVESVDYYSAGYQSDYSRALGGIISLKARSPDVQERTSKGLFYVDNLSAGGLFETRLDEKSSFLISGRYSYVGFFLKNAMKDNKALDLTVAPEFMDLTGVYQRQLGDGESLKISTLASRDRLSFVFSEPLRGNPSVRGNFSNTVQFFRIIPQWSKKIDDKNAVKTSLSVGKDQIAVDVGDRYFNINSLVLTTRGEWDHQFNEKSSLQTGWDHQYARTDVQLKLPTVSSVGGVSNPTTAQDDRLIDLKNVKENNLGAYVRFEHKFNKEFKVIPGARADRFSSTKETFLKPRLAMQYNFDEYRFFKAGYGQYVQPPEPQEVAENYGNPDIKSPLSDHYTLGYEHDFKRGSSVGSSFGVGTFYRRFYNLVIPSTNIITRQGVQAFEVYNNEGSGKAYGIELSYKYKQDQWSAALAYTYSKSLRQTPQNGEYNFEYDQTHNFNFIAAYEFSNQWKISGRYRYVTGSPYTPVTGSIFDADNETYYPLRGGLYSERNRPFQQLDVRIDKKFILDTEIWSFYLDVQNILNTKNPEGLQYSYDYAEKKEITGLPILPALGIRGEF